MASRRRSGKHAATTVARAAEPRAVVLSRPLGHPSGRASPEESGAPLVPGMIPGATSATNPCNPRQ
jgi:hypothetical protein